MLVGSLLNANSIYCNISPFTSNLASFQLLFSTSFSCLALLISPLVSFPPFFLFHSFLCCRKTSYLFCVILEPFAIHEPGEFSRRSGAYCHTGDVVLPVSAERCVLTAEDRHAQRSHCKIKRTLMITTS